MNPDPTISFGDQVRAIPGGEHLDVCFACGTCVSKCMIQQKLEPDYNPRRLLRMVMLDMREEAFQSPTTWLCSACDLCYPACPQEIHISGVIGAVKQLAVEAGYESPLETVVVDDDLCSGCGICVMVCPYEAPSLLEKPIDGQPDRVSTVDENKCMGCGICVAACPLGAISRPGVSNAEVRAQIEIEAGDGAPRLIVFVCDWSLRAVEDVTLLESYPPNVRIVHIPCSGRIDPEMALMALRSGIDGVLVCGCAPGECHYKRGTDVSACKTELLNRMLDQMTIGSSTGNGCVRFVQIGTMDRGRIRNEVDGMLESLEAQEEASL
ncbi:MAG: hydrogenase iron-sulfur subunit [Anaerolineae bacterium]|jgi:coenzyme F420-reducing hydrogenase delta subunit/heterodisulfide reductase subunit C